MTIYIYNHVCSIILKQNEILTKCKRLISTKIPRIVFERYMKYIVAKDTANQFPENNFQA